MRRPGSRNASSRSPPRSSCKARAGASRTSRKTASGEGAASRFTRRSTMKLTDKVAMVTGAGSGIGQATAVLFATEGAKVAVVDLREDAAKATVERIERAGGQGLAIRADVSRAADVQAAVNGTLARWSRLDVLYANAGVPQHPTSVEDVDEAIFDQIMNVNVKGVF